VPSGLIFDKGDFPLQSHVLNYPDRTVGRSETTFCLLGKKKRLVKGRRWNLAPGRSRVKGNETADAQEKNGRTLRMQLV